jgi:hypothetical protein
LTPQETAIGDQCFDPRLDVQNFNNPQRATNLSNEWIDRWRKSWNQWKSSLNRRMNYCIVYSGLVKTTDGHPYVLSPGVPCIQAVMELCEELEEDDAERYHVVIECAGNGCPK